MVKKFESGQILLVVVLTMIVALTVGLSISARVVTELKLSKQNEESQRAFQAAESGIQQALSNSQTTYTLPSTDLGNNAEVIAEKTVVKNSSLVMNNGQEVDQVTGADVWLSNYSSDENFIFLNPMGNGNPVNIKLYWGSANQDSCATAPALEVVILIGPKTNPSIQKNIFEATGCSGRTPGSKEATLAGADKPDSSGPTYRYVTPLVLGTPEAAPSNGLLMRIIPIYNSTPIGFLSTTQGIPFPAQGSTVTSTGTSGDTVRKVTYFQSYPQLPVEIFPYSLLSQ